ncbi:MAG: LacI family DNA-binding transcriptional regulator [Rectinemataceae bacterium]
MTLREIAEAAQVSIGTVDRVLHDRGRVSPETKAKIEALIDRYGYKPNPIARHLKLNRKYSFAALMPRAGEDSGYWKIADAGVEKAAKELAAFGVSVRKIEYNRYDPVSFFENTRRMADMGFDGLLMTPLLPEAGASLLKALPEGFPVVFFDAQLPGYSPLSRIGQDAFRSGVLAGRLLDAFSAKKGPYFVVSSHGEDFHIRKRIEGFLSYFGSPALTPEPSPAPSREIRTFENIDLEHREKRETFLRKMLEGTQNPGGIFVTNVSVHGVASYVNGKNTDHIAVVGYDLVPENECRLRSGMIDCILSQRPEYQTYEGIYRLYRHVALQQAVEKESVVPIDIYVRENLP